MEDVYARQWEFLVSSIIQGRIFNAYLFYAPENINIAEDFFLAVSHKERGEDYLLKRNFEDKQALATNLYVVEPLLVDEKGREKSGKEITIGQVKELSKFASLSSLNNGYKAVIIKQAHCLNLEAQNAFLKILEEPKGDVFFILLTEHPDRLLETVRSRCSKVFFPFKNNGKLSAEKQKLFDALCAGSYGKRFAYSAELVKDNKFADLKKELKDWISYFREKLLEGDSKYSEEDVYRILESALKAYYLLENTNVNQKLNIENFLLEL